MGLKRLSFTSCTALLSLFLYVAVCASGSDKPGVLSKAIQSDLLYPSGVHFLNPGDTLRYDDDSLSYGLWLPGQDVYWAMRFTPAMDCTVKEAHIAIWVYSGVAPTCTLIIWDDNNGEPGNRVFSTTFTASDSSWNYVSITGPVAYAESIDFWIGYFLKTPGGVDTALAVVDSGVDYDDRNGVGVLGVWYTMNDLGGEGDLVIRAFVEYSGTSVAERTNTLRPTQLRLNQNMPNPFHRITIISYEISVWGEVNLSIYDATGSLVRTLVDGEADPGYYRAIWNGRNDDGSLVPDGVYFSRLSAGTLEATVKTIFIR